MTKILCFTNYKGGVCKTTSVWNIASALANSKNNVLMVDIDSQHNLTQIAGIEDYDIGTYDVLINNSNIEPIELRKNLYLLPGSLDLREAEIIISGKVKSEYLLNKRLAELKDDYDYILIDTPPSGGLLTINGIMAAQYYVIPVYPNDLARTGLDMTVSLMEELDVEFDFILFTNFDRRIKEHKKVVSEMRLEFNGKTLNTVIRTNSKLGELPRVNLDIFEHAKDSNGADDYNRATKELVKLFK